MRETNICSVTESKERYYFFLLLANTSWLVGGGNQQPFKEVLPRDIFSHTTFHASVGTLKTELNRVVCDGIGGEERGLENGVVVRGRERGIVRHQGLPVTWCLEAAGDYIWKNYESRVT